MKQIYFAAVMVPLLLSFFSPSSSSGCVQDLQEQVLIADDEDFVRSVLRFHFQQLGFNVLEAEDGQAALQIFLREEGRFTLVVIDKNMPNMNGLELIHVIRDGAINPTVPLLFTSGESVDGVLSKQGKTFFLGKPFTSVEIRKVLEALKAPPD